MKLSNDVKIGTLVKVTGLDGWHRISDIKFGALNIDWFNLEGIVGSFQAGHITDCNVIDEE